MFLKNPLTSGFELDDNDVGAGVVACRNARDVTRTAVIPHPLFTQHVQLYPILRVLKNQDKFQENKYLDNLYKIIFSVVWLPIFYIFVRIFLLII